MSFDCAQPAPYCCCENPLREVLRNPAQPRAFRHLAFGELIGRHVATLGPMSRYRAQLEARYAACRNAELSAA